MLSVAIWLASRIERRLFAQTADTASPASTWPRRVATQYRREFRLVFFGRAPAHKPQRVFLEVAGERTTCRIEIDIATRQCRRVSTRLAARPLSTRPSAQDTGTFIGGAGSSGPLGEAGPSPIAAHAWEKPPRFRGRAQPVRPTVHRCIAEVLGRRSRPMSLIIDHTGWRTISIETATTANEFGWVVVPLHYDFSPTTVLPAVRHP